MKKLLAVLLTAILSMSVLTACGGGEEKAAEAAPAAEAPATEEAAPAAAGASFEKVQETYAILVDEYNQVKELYESDQIEADQNIEDALNQCADVINEMGEISSDEVSEEDCQTLLDTMVKLEEIFNQVLGGMQAAGGEGTPASEETIAALGEAYNTLSETYNVVADAYMSDAIEQNDEIEAHLAQAKDLIEQVGSISTDEITEENAVSIVDSMQALIEYLGAIVDAM